MANTIKLKKSSVAAKVPLTTDLEYGELAINYTDGNLFFKTAGNVVTTIASTQFVSVTGNVTGNYFIGNGSLLTGIVATGGSSINNGTSNVVVSASGNVTTTVSANLISTVHAGGLSVSGVISATGSITAGAFSNLSGGNIDTAGTVSATGNITGGNLATAGTVSATGDITSAGVVNSASVSTSGNIRTAGTVSATGNITGGNVVTGGLISATGNITGGNVTTAGLVSATGNVTGGGFFTSGGTITGGNISATGAVTASTVSASGNVTGGGFFTSGGTITGGNISATGTVSATGNVNAGGFFTSGGTITGGNISATNAVTAATVSASGNITGGNINLAGNIVDTGNITITSSAANAWIFLTPTGTGVVRVDKDITNGQANGVGNIGNATGYFNTVFAKATSAQYADLAELYRADAAYVPGTVVVFGGRSEISQSTTSHATAIAGVVSEQPAYVMNAGLRCKYPTAVAMIGRVPCRVTGPVAKGDLLVSSDEPGTAQTMQRDRYEPGCVIGKALESHRADGPGVIEIVVGRL